MPQDLADAIAAHPFMQAQAGAAVAAPAPQGVVAPADAMLAPARAVQVAYLGDKPRVVDFPLAWPLQVDGVEFRSITVKRLTTREVGVFVDQIRGKAAGERVRFPIFVDAAGQPIPDAVWDALDPDDTDALTEVADRFLPARFRDGRETDASDPATGATSGASSDTSPTPSQGG